MHTLIVFVSLRKLSWSNWTWKVFSILVTKGSPTYCFPKYWTSLNNLWVWNILADSDTASAIKIKMFFTIGIRISIYLSFAIIAMVFCVPLLAVSIIGIVELDPWCWFYKTLLISSLKWRPYNLGHLTLVNLSGLVLYLQLWLGDYPRREYLNLSQLRHLMPYS